MLHSKAINVNRIVFQRPLKRPGRIGAFALLCLLALLIMPVLVGASEHALWVAGNEEAWKLDEQSVALELMIPEVGRAKGVALDDQRDILWVMTRHGQIKSYGFDGTLRLDIPLPLESVQQMLHYQALVEEYEEKIRLLFADYHQWKHDHQQSFREWERQHKKAYDKWRKEHRNATWKEHRNATWKEKRNGTWQ